MALDRVGADSEHHRLGLLEVGQLVPELARLLGASGGVVLWVEVEDDRAAREVLEGVLVAILVGEVERGCLLAGVDEWHVGVLVGVWGADRRRGTIRGHRIALPGTGEPSATEDDGRGTRPSRVATGGLR